MKKAASIRSEKKLGKFRTRLKNGLRVVILPPDSPIVTSEKIRQLEDEEFLPLSLKPEAKKQKAKS